MPVHAVMLAAALAGHSPLALAEEEPTVYRHEIIKGDAAAELAQYADGMPVVLAEDKAGHAVVLLLDVPNQSIKFEDDPGPGRAFTSASRCVANTLTVWYRTPSGYVDSGHVCQLQVIEGDGGSSYAGEKAPYQVIRKYPVSSATTRVLVDLGITGEYAVATNSNGKLIMLIFSASVTWSQWLRLACVSVASSQVKCYTKSDKSQLCHKSTNYIYNKSSSCPNSNQPWVRQSGTNPCGCG